MMAISWSITAVTIRLVAVQWVTRAVKWIKLKAFKAFHFARGWFLNTDAAISVQVETSLALKLKVSFLIWAAAVVWVTARTIPAEIHGADNWLIRAPAVVTSWGRAVQAGKFQEADTVPRFFNAAAKLLAWNPALWA